MAESNWKLLGRDEMYMTMEVAKAQGEKGEYDISSHINMMGFILTTPGGQRHNLDVKSIILEKISELDNQE